MKFQFLGTGAILTGPLSASILIDDSILIDVPNGLCKYAKRNNVDLCRVNDVFITHFHGDHYFDFPFLLLTLGLRSKRSNPLNVYGPAGIENQLKRLHAFAFDNWDRVTSNVMLRTYELGPEPINISSTGSNYRVNAFNVDHGNLQAFGLTVSDGTSTLGYSGDTELCDSVHKIIDQSDSAVLDTSFINSRAGHMGLEDIIQLSKKYKNKKFYATHMSEDVRNSNPPEGLTIPTDFEKFSL